MNLKNCSLHLLALVCSATLFASGGISFSDNGILSYGNSTWGTLHMNSRWQPVNQSRHFIPAQADGTQFEGVFKSKEGADLFDYTLEALTTDSSSVQLSATAQSQEGFQSNMLAYEGLLPIKQFAGTILTIDGEPLELPITFGGEATLLIKSARKVEIPTHAGNLSFKGNFTIMVVDGRKFGGPNFSFRFFFSQHKGVIHQSEFGAQVSAQSLSVSPLSLATVANRGFADEVAGDGKGGWTDQGPELDLSAFSAVSEIASTLSFEVSTTETSTLVLSKDPKRSNLTFGEVTVPQNYGSPAYLYLLHASAYTWGTVGQIKVSYQDGTEQSIDVQSSKDIGNWWNPVGFPNAAIVWDQQVNEANIGLYQSRFELRKKPIKKIAFGAGNDSIWMIVGATLTNTAIALPQPEFFTVRENNDWAPIETPLTIEPQSVLDFSAWNHAPAGKFGPVITTSEGHFAFANAPQTPVRFLGTNLNFDANFLSKEESDALALRLRQMGYNSLRIHHYDILLAGGWNPSEYIISEDMQDRLDYLFYALKQQGLYISTDLFTIRRIRNEKLNKLVANNHAAFKALIPISSDAMDEWKRFARDLLTHKNPYTGMTWAEDPALFSICPVNEDTIWAAINTNKEVKALYHAGFNQWIQTNPRPTQNDAALNAAINEYLAEVQMAADTEMRRFLKNELGVKALLTGNNWKYHYAQTPIRAQYDYVDNHGYWDHPSFPNGPWKLPYSNSQKSATQDLANIPRRMFLTRIEDKPFTVTEYNFCYPNKFRNEAGPLMGTYSALQDYDGLYRFSWAHYRKRITKQQPIEGFDVAQDPIGLLNEYIIAMLWRRADVSALENEAVFVVNSDRAYASGNQPASSPKAEDLVYKRDAHDHSDFGKTPPDFEMDYTYLGLTKRISSRFETDADSAATNAPFTELQPQVQYAVKTNETKVILEKAGNFLVETP
ncbi:hypothetical protein SH580_17200 [Coraliomargarita algicola]|uniref:Glycoside hydrolase family 5 domain-containing protein n=1 Tax=Coraliomargarita algicola TaxID=3092156 RepID=A0ABZ0RIF8_9BACT|nr:hypothetical protein [Coraliomargarita sp. J2-16]WPJ95161.1 hypothetical protein SH580_17200 [Coraliomargarita sp. J2-16]